MQSFLTSIAVTLLSLLLQATPTWQQSSPVILRGLNTYPKRNPLSLFTKAAPYITQFDTKSYTEFERSIYHSKTSWMVIFYANWCGHSQRLAENFVPKIREIFDEDSSWKYVLKIGVVDCGYLKQTGHKKTAHLICQKHGNIDGYPTVKFFEPGMIKSPENFEILRQKRNVKRILENDDYKIWMARYVAVAAENLKWNYPSRQPKPMLDFEASDLTARNFLRKIDEFQQVTRYVAVFRLGYYFEILDYAQILLDFSSYRGIVLYLLHDFDENDEEAIKYQTPSVTLYSYCKASIKMSIDDFRRMAPSLPGVAVGHFTSDPSIGQHLYKNRPSNWDCHQFKQSKERENNRNVEIAGIPEKTHRRLDANKKYDIWKNYQPNPNSPTVVKRPPTPKKKAKSPMYYHVNRKHQPVTERTKIVRPIQPTNFNKNVRVKPEQTNSRKKVSSRPKQTKPTRFRPRPKNTSNSKNQNQATKKSPKRPKQTPKTESNLVIPPIQTPKIETPRPKKEYSDYNPPMTPKPYRPRIKPTEAPVIAAPNVPEIIDLPILTLDEVDIKIDESTSTAVATTTRTKPEIQSTTEVGKTNEADNNYNNNKNKKILQSNDTDTPEITTKTTIISNTTTLTVIDKSTTRTPLDGPKKIGQAGHSSRVKQVLLPLVALIVLAFVVFLCVSLK